MAVGIISILPSPDEESTVQRRETTYLGSPDQKAAELRAQLILNPPLTASPSLRHHVAVQDSRQRLWEKSCPCLQSNIPITQTWTVIIYISHYCYQGMGINKNTLCKGQPVQRERLAGTSPIKWS